ncbi:hypothetical protein OPV22_026725 [Ensete ventricosum]|uniref:Uncharacterized protein n=1 Tax=Ensete ventricosum TaxID=4639 RepID=A0AAV8Q1X6_ENSVE|nr:hypothetical protein OPV22_026725 [Ensete ventricosum]
MVYQVACVLCFGKGGAVKIVHNNIRGGKVVLLSQDGLKAILPVLIDRYGILHDQDDTEDQGGIADKEQEEGTDSDDARRLLVSGDREVGADELRRGYRRGNLDR